MSELGVAIMAGGPGLRLAAINPGRPKALADFDGATLLDYQLDQVLPLNPEVIVVLAYHGAEAVQQHLSRRSNVDVLANPTQWERQVPCTVTPQPERWLVRNVDHISDVICSLVATNGPCTAVITDVKYRSMAGDPKRGAIGVAGTSHAPGSSHNRLTCSTKKLVHNLTRPSTGHARPRSRPDARSGRLEPFRYLVRCGYTRAFTFR